VLIFMPAAFTFNCPTEIEDAAEQLRRVPEGRRRGLHRHHRHALLAQGLARDLAGRRQGQFPLVGDPTHQLTRAFGVHIDEEGLALRGTFVINPEGVIKTMEIHDNAIARDVTETLRKLKAAQYVAAHPNEVCPAKWKEGERPWRRRWTWSARSKPSRCMSPGPVGRGSRGTCPPAQPATCRLCRIRTAANSGGRTPQRRTIMLDANSRLN
jgi:hypothetical protein